MKKILPLLPILFLIYWGCEDPKEENKPTPVTLSVDSGVLKWNMNEEDDFFRYSLYGSNNSSMENKTLIYETQSRLDTTHTFDSNEYFPYYQVDVMNLNEMVSNSNILNVGVYLWGVYYSIENTYSLDLPYNQLTGEIPPEIWNLTNLTYLDLGWNQLTGSIPPEIGNLTNLTYLDLDFNQLTGSIPSQIGNLTNLERLSLHNNQLTGSTPSEIGNLTNLNYLGLKNNQLTGEIPPEISNLTNLEDLNLSYNQLSGSIPPEIGNLTNLTHLSLKSNELTGEIPESICDLNINWSNSYYFHISNNQLCPPYPPCIEDYVGYQDTSDCP